MSYGSALGSTPISSAQDLVADARSLSALKAGADKATPDTIRETAKQFESLFMRELLKSMREATMKSGMLDNAGSDLGTDLFDQQMSVSMSGQPGGLSDLIAQQLSRQMGVEMPGSTVGMANSSSLQPVKAPDTLTPKSSVGKLTASDMALTPVAPKKAPTSTQADFVSKHTDAANKIEKATGIPASFMLGQAGHETGWGKHQIKNKDGSNSFNLFGIKAGSSWTGKVAEITTTEYVNGVAQKKIAKFRAYDSFEDSFKDYARLISDSPRYAKARQQTQSVTAFATGLQKAGYATDPEYAAKLSRAINTTLHLRRAQVQA
ncbi:flagellar assembly peptidoglycan hydrolase FlgJ [Rhodoferax sp. TBRC 17198]|uniref:flagellar assembly peptidoglycan hydrolase FlgJ n=1 Tax=Rhodoferax potami TaxID=3068338 RepID=UPI0028BE7E55|nr:flagellar assembly peptidoglycan hydrolase FlgJ [Rhodoferax sp. TBRC 17198]MDT7524326.1 flagellar assembly peptidoglycan hydrolase FlgJ [Rhodoferax sp. TBRC 17198]